MKLGSVIRRRGISMISLILAAALTAGLTVLWISDSGSQIRHRTFESAVLDRTYEYNIYLPAGYGDSDKDYPVLYLLHGSFGNENNWVRRGNVRKTADRLISEGLIPPAIIVMPGSKSWWVDGYNEQAETAFFEDLIPHIDRSWRTVSDRNGRFIAGLSAGGYGAVNFILKRPELFAAGAALSPAIYTPQPPEDSTARRHPAFQDETGAFDPDKWNQLSYVHLLERYFQKETPVPLYILSGNRDKYEVADHASVLYRKLRKYQPSLVEYQVTEGGHEWRLWRNALPDAMIYMFRFIGKP